MRTSILISVCLINVLLSYGQATRHANQVPAQFHNKIDDIKTAGDIEKLLESIDKKRFDEFTVNESMVFLTFNGREDKACEALAKEKGLKPWTKIDFDGNGHTDLLVVGEYYHSYAVLAVLDKGNNHFEVSPLTRRSFQECTVPVIRSSDGQVLVDYLTPGSSRTDNSATAPAKSTLVYKFGDFVEFNPQAEQHRHTIEKIAFKTTGCFGTCPIFGLTINADGTAVYESIEFNNKPKGKYKGQIEKKYRDEIDGLLNYLDFTALRDDYAVGWTDDQSVSVAITYDKGKQKNIHDYGLLGTFGLSRLYRLLFDLRQNQTWH